MSVGPPVNLDPPTARATDDATDDATDGAADLADLLRRTALGDEAAFAQVYRIMAPRLYGMALRVLRQPGLSEEVTQEAFMAIWTTSPRFDPTRGSAVAWMLTITHRRAIDRVRNAHAGSRRDHTWAWQHLDASVTDTTVESAHASIEAARVQAALRNLPAKQRTAILLAFFAGQTHTEVATSLGIPLGTAKSRIRDGLHALNNLLATTAAPI